MAVSGRSTIDSTGAVGWFTSLALDASSQPHISYHDIANTDLKYAGLVDDQPPTVNTGGPYNGTQGSPVNLQATVNDLESDALITTWSYEIDDADDGATCTFGDDSQVQTTITCTDDGSFTLTLTANDGLNPPMSHSTTLTLGTVTQLCASNYTGLLRYSDTCRGHETAVSVPNASGPVTRLRQPLQRVAASARDRRLCRARDQLCAARGWPAQCLCQQLHAGDADGKRSEPVFQL